MNGALLNAPNMDEDSGFDPDGVWPASGGADRMGRDDLAQPIRPSGAVRRATGIMAYFDRYRRYRIGNLAVGATIDYDVKANWKLLIENFNECCHCGPAHPELSAQVPSFKAGLVSGYNGGGAALGDGIESLTVTGKTNRSPLPGLTDEDRRTYYGTTLRPNVFFSLHPDYVLVHIMRPEAADLTKVTCHWLFSPEAIAHPGFRAARGGGVLGSGQSPGLGNLRTDSTGRTEQVISERRHLRALRAAHPYLQRLCIGQIGSRSTRMRIARAMDQGLLTGSPIPGRQSATESARPSPPGGAAPRSAPTTGIGTCRPPAGYLILCTHRPVGQRSGIRRFRRAALNLDLQSDQRGEHDHANTMYLNALPTHALRR